MPAPKMHLSNADKQLLQLLGELICSSSEHSTGNLPSNVAALSDADAQHLLALITSYIESSEFYRSSHFIEAVTNDGGPSTTARELYLTLRQERGRSRVMSSYHWSEFQVRLGISRNLYPSSRTRPLTDDLFLRKEGELLRAAGVGADVAALAIRMLRDHCPQLGPEGRALKQVRARDIRAAIVEPFSASRLSAGTIPTTKLVAAMSLVADMTVLFTTRDWNVVGTLSAIAGYGVALSVD